MFSFLNSKRPLWQREYIERTPVKLPVNEADLVYTVMDLETTGFDLLKDRILSVAVVQVQGNGLRANQIRDWIVYQKKPQVNEAMKIHGILPSETIEGESEPLMLEELIPLMKGTIVVGHHIQFDAAMINRSMERNFGLHFRNRLIDTANLAMSELDAFKKSGYSNQRPPNLDEVCQQLGINPVERHTAIGDAFTTSQVFLYLKGKLQQRMKDRFSPKSLPISKF